MATFARLPQSAVSQDFFNDTALGQVGKGNYFHFTATLRTDHGVNLAGSLIYRVA
jgi:hypothetical protein